MQPKSILKEICIVKIYYSISIEMSGKSKKIQTYFQFKYVGPLSEQSSPFIQPVSER